MIKLENVSFGYGEVNTIENISFEIEKGDFAAIMGANGAGKTTMTKLFNGILKPKSGDVITCGMNTKTTKTSVLAKKIGFLFQNPDRQICCNTIEDEIMFGLNCVCDNAEEKKRRLDEVISQFGFDRKAEPFSLSRGQRQRVALASVIAVKPEILILDEPTTGLDYSECMHVMEIIGELNKNGVTVIMVCHDMEVVLDFAKTAVVISGGKLLAKGDVKEIFRQEDVLRAASLLPPQIIGLSEKLGIHNVNTYTELADAVENIVKGGEAK